jgi:hypothetical protein
MSVETFCARLAGLLAATTVSEQRLEIVASEIGAFFEVRAHEVGLFSVKEKQHKIEFLWPRGLPSNSHIPLEAVNSLVAKTAKKRESYIDNAFAKSRHLFLFEHFLADKSERISVQKVMSVPVLSGDGIKGVVQLVRKGESLEEAGADFTDTNLVELQCIAGTLGKFDL